MGPKDWVIAAPVSRTVSFVVFGGPVTPWVVSEAMVVVVGCKMLGKEFVNLVD
jgi:hypothetical protein